MDRFPPGFQPNFPFPNPNPTTGSSNPSGPTQAPSIQAPPTQTSNMPSSNTDSSTTTPSSVITSIDQGHPPTIVSTIFGSQTSISSLPTAGAPVLTSFIALSTTTLTAIPSASPGLKASSAANAAGASTSNPSPMPEPVLRDQTIVGVAVGIGAWLLIVIAVLSCLLWRKRKRNRGIRLEDEAGMESSVTMAETRREITPPIPQRAPSLPPPFFSRAASTTGDIPPPLHSHPVSRSDEEPSSPVSTLSSEVDRPIGTHLNSPRLPIQNHSPRVSEAGSSGRSIIRMRPLSERDQSPSSPDDVSELPPSLGKLNSWLEENRRRSRMTALSGTRPMSLSELKEVYRNSTAT